MTSAPARRGGDVTSDEVRVRPGELKRTSSRDWLIRFGFGAALGTLGLLAFAVVAAVTVTRWPLWAALIASTS